MMKKRILNMLMVIALGVALTACGGNNADTNGNGGSNAGTNTSTNSNGSGESDTNAGTGDEEGADGEGDTDAEAGTEGGAGAEAGSAAAIVDALLAKIEQPVLMPLEGDMVADMYHLDPALLEEYSIRTPMMNVKTNEVAVLKVKDAADIAKVEEGIKQRAADVQKSFESYLPDQYENAQNYKLVTKGNYILFVISEEADKFVEQFEALVE